MAAGKSTVGKMLARKIETNFYDLDRLIEARYGTIPSIFARGESEFRQCEFQAISDLVATERAGVIALGGGALAHPATATLLEAHAYTIFLDVPLATIEKRLGRSRAVRPLAGANPEALSIAQLYAQRLPQYQKADLTIDAKAQSKDEIVDAIAAWIETKSIRL